MKASFISHPLHIFMLIFIFAFSFFLTLPYLVGQIAPSAPLLLSCYVSQQTTGSQPVSRTEYGVFCSAGVDACDDPLIGNFCTYSCHQIQCNSPCEAETSCSRAGACSDIFDSQGKKIGRVVTCTATCVEGCTGVVVGTIPPPPPVGPYNAQSCRSNQPFDIFTSVCKDDCDSSTEFCDDRIQFCGGCAPRNKKCSDSSTSLYSKQVCKDDCPEGYYCDPQSPCNQCIPKQPVSCFEGSVTKSFNSKINTCADDCNPRTQTCSPTSCTCVRKVGLSSSE